MRAKVGAGILIIAIVCSVGLVLWADKGLGDGEGEFEAEYVYVHVPGESIIVTTTMSQELVITTGTTTVITTPMTTTPETTTPATITGDAPPPEETIESTLVIPGLTTMTFPVTTITKITPRMKFSMKGTGSILDREGNTLEQWQINPLSSVYESAHGETYRVEVKTTIDSNIVKWSTLRICHQVYFVNQETKQMYLVWRSDYMPSNTQNYQVNDELWEMTQTYSGALSQFTALSISNDPANPTLCSIIVYNTMFRTLDIHGNYITSPGFDDRAKIVGGVHTFLFMDGAMVVVYSAVLQDPTMDDPDKDPDRGKEFIIVGGVGW